MITFNFSCEPVALDVKFQSFLDLPIVPPLGHRHNYSKQLFEKKSRGNKTLQVSNMRFLALPAFHLQFSNLSGNKDATGPAGRDL